MNNWIVSSCFYLTIRNIVVPRKFLLDESIRGTGTRDKYWID